jgi:hypothetical protein
MHVVGDLVVLCDRIRRIGGRIQDGIVCELRVEPNKQIVVTDECYGLFDSRRGRKGCAMVERSGSAEDCDGCRLASGHYGQICELLQDILAVYSDEFERIGSLFTQSWADQPLLRGWEVRCTCIS